MLRELQHADPVPFHLTAILDDNAAAARLLEAGLPGLPKYVPLACVRTFTFQTGKLGRGVRPEPPHPDARAFAADTLARQELAPATAASLDFVTLGDPVEAAAAIWDQRSVRQLVLAEAPRWLQMLRPVMSLAGDRLPAAGKAINVAYVSQLALRNQDAGAFVRLLKLLCAKANQSRIEYLSISLASENPLSVMAGRLARHVTRSTLYAVHWDGDAGCPPLASFPYVEAALL
jgi:hypothetical protein